MLINNETIERYLDLAARCERAAAHATTQTERRRLLAMAEDYLARALRA